MLNNSSKQTGSAPIIIVAIILIILGVLGFVLWENISHSNTSQGSTSTAQASVPVTYRTYRDDANTISFQYPSTWNLGTVSASGIDRTISITTDEGNVITLESGAQGVGGTCGGLNIPIRSTIDVVPTAFKTPKTTTLSFTVTGNGDGTYKATYGLTDEYTKLGDEQVCDNVFYYYFDSGNPNYHLVGFSGKKQFASLDDAKKFITSDEYSAIKKMILSLNY